MIKLVSNYKNKLLSFFVLDVTVILAGVLAFLVLTLPIFFSFSSTWVGYQLAASRSLAIYFIVQELLRWTLVQAPIQHIKKRWLEHLLTTLLIAYFFFAKSEVLASIPEDSPLSPKVLSLLYLTVISAVAAWRSLLLQIDENRNVKWVNLSIPVIYVVSFLVPIIIGTLLLLAPKSTVNGISFIDALFTATSAVCVTGLSVLSTGHEFTRLGQTVIMILFQIGALGTMTLTMAFSGLFLGSLGVGGNVVLSQILNENKIGNAKNLLLRIILFTIVIETLGAIALFYSMPSLSRPGQSVDVFTAVFHAISAFCNAGFSLYDSSVAYSAFQNSYLSPFIIMTLIVTGGLGFPVMSSLYSLLIQKLKGKVAHLDLHSKIVLTTTAILIPAGAIGVLLLEGSNSFSELPADQTLMQSLFLSITSRTAGFNMIDTSALGLTTLLLVSGLMFIGGAPMSTAGGLKVTTFFVAFVHLKSRFRGLNKPNAFHRSIPDSAVSRVLATISLSLVFLFIGITMLSAFEPGLELEAILFEAFSAWATVGLSTGITASLSTPSKLVLCLLMFAGRVGILVFLEAIIVKSKSGTKHSYVQEKIII